MKWTKIEIDRAIDLLKLGEPYKEIGKKLNRTSKSVKLKLNNFNFKYSDYYKNKLYETIKCPCGKEFNDLISNHRLFCSSSCSASFNNPLKEKKIKINTRRRKVYKEKKQNECLNCSGITTNIYCNSSCQFNYNQKIIIKRIEDGDTTLSNKQYKKYLIEKHGNKCMECGWDKVHPLTGKVPIELEHIDGNSENNHLNNLKLLCPNCHSLTPTYKGLNKGNGRYKRMIRYKEGKSF